MLNLIFKLTLISRRIIKRTVSLLIWHRRMISFLPLTVLILFKIIKSTKTTHNSPSRNTMKIITALTILFQINFHRIITIWITNNKPQIISILKSHPINITRKEPFLTTILISIKLRFQKFNNQGQTPKTACFIICCPLLRSKLANFIVLKNLLTRIIMTTIIIKSRREEAIIGHNQLNLGANTLTKIRIPSIDSILLFYAILIYF